jgi:aspartokinase-like uncharacterized kinase
MPAEGAPIERAAPTAIPRGPSAARSIDTVIKVGGALLASPVAWAWAIAELDRLPRDGRLLVVPGGGPFADAVRGVDRAVGLGDSAAHWAAIIGMDQFAYVLADRLAAAVVIDDVDQVAGAAAAGRLAVLAPSRWLRAADPLPHSWDVTADSIAAWIARQVGAERLMLLKLATDTDPYFPRLTAGGPPLRVDLVLAGAPLSGYR